MTLRLRSFPIQWHGDLQAGAAAGGFDNQRPLERCDPLLQRRRSNVPGVKGGGVIPAAEGKPQPLSTTTTRSSWGSAMTTAAPMKYGHDEPR